MKVALLSSQRSELNDGKNDESEVEQCVVNGGTSAALRVLTTNVVGFFPCWESEGALSSLLSTFMPSAKSRTDTALGTLQLNSLKAQPKDVV